MALCGSRLSNAWSSSATRRKQFPQGDVAHAFGRSYAEMHSCSPTLDEPTGKPAPVSGQFIEALLPHDAGQSSSGCVGRRLSFALHRQSRIGERSDRRYDLNPPADTWPLPAERVQRLLSGCARFSVYRPREIPRAHPGTLRQKLHRKVSFLKSHFMPNYGCLEFPR
jgi:hypothetical protein